MLAGVVLSAVVVGAMAAGGPTQWTHGAPAPHAAAPRVQVGSRVAPAPQASNDTISVTGTSPTATTLSWKATTDLLFGYYEVDESASSAAGPWTTIYTNTTSSATSLYVTGQTPGASAWFRDVDHGTTGDTQDSNVVRAQNPSNATLSYADASKTTVSLSWTNKATYGGLLAFVSYSIKESINGATYTTIGTESDPATTSFSATGVTGLTTNTSYRFQVWTTDQCNACANGSQAQITRSSTAIHLFIDQPKVDPSSSVKVDDPLSLSIYVAGGTPPYSFSWFELPSGCTAANANPVSCTPTVDGTYSPSVTVTDSKGITLTSLAASVTVSGQPGGGSGGGGGGAKPSTQGTTAQLIVGALIAIVLVALLVYAFWRHRRKHAMEEPAHPLVPPPPPPPPR